MIGNIIKEYRLKANLTQSNLAEMINTTQYIISNYENNHLKPNLERVKLISEKLHIPIEFFEPLNQFKILKKHEYEVTQFSLVLREHRKKLGLTQLEVARLVKISLQTYEGYELSFNYPRKDKLAKLESALQIQNLEQYWVMPHSKLHGEKLYCSKCQQMKDKTEFHKNNSTGRGYHNYCKTCRK